MKILNVSGARAAWIVDMAQINPGGRSLWDLFQALAARYRFSRYPQHLLDYNKDSALEFGSGTFLRGPNQDIRVGLTFYNNAIAADTVSSTDNAEALLQDVATWAAQEFNVVMDKSAILRTTYFSRLDVKFDDELLLVNPKLKFIPSILSSQAVQIDGRPVRFSFGGISAWGENAGKDAALEAFRLERKWDTSFDDNIYFAQAPLRTQDHVNILESIEASLKG